MYNSGEHSLLSFLRYQMVDNYVLAMNIKSASFDAAVTVGRITCLSLFPWETAEKTSLNFHGTEWRLLRMIHIAWVLDLYSEVSESLKWTDLVGLNQFISMFSSQKYMPIGFLG